MIESFQKPDGKTDAGALIKICVRSVDLLLDRAGSPLEGWRIHPDAAESIYDDADALASRGDVTIEVRVPSSDINRSPEVAAAIHSHFQSEERHVRRELKEMVRSSLKSLALALVVVMFLVFFMEWLQALGEGRLYALLGHSIIVIGWIMLWVPCETLLFGRTPLRRKCEKFSALATARVRLVPSESTDNHYQIPERLGGES